MHPIQALRDEHQLIEQVLSAVEARLEELDGVPFPRVFFDRALAFLDTFADGSHRYREERALFPLMEARGIARRGGPVGTSEGDHDYGRVFLAGVRENLDAAESGSPGAVAAVRDYGALYVRLLRHHIGREETVLFPLAETALTTSDLARLERQFALAPPPASCRTFAAEVGGNPCDGRAGGGPTRAVTLRS